MPELLQVRTVHTGYTGAPGYTNMYFFGDPMSPASVTTACTAVKAFWVAVASTFPSIWSCAIDGDLSVLDEATGDLIRTVAGSSTSATSGGGVSTHAGGVGACCTWTTSAVHGSRRLKGRTFMVPLCITAYEADGSLAPTYRTILSDAANTLRAVANFGVWGRPRDADPDAVPPVTALTGEWSGATASSVRDKVAILRSRRD